MGYISEDYCSEELSGMLMEKGYIGATNAYLDKDDLKVEQITLQSAMKWLREVHRIHIEICLYKTSEDDIEPKKSRKTPYYTFGVWDSVTGYNVDERLINDFIGDTYEQACEAAIKYCLENLI